LIYLNNAATTLPKPPQVIRAIRNALEGIGANPGRGGDPLVYKADKLIYSARIRAAKFFGLPDPARLIFTPGCTYSINIAIRGALKNGDHVITTGRMHNAISRTVFDKRLGLQVSSIEWDGKSGFTEEMFNKYLTPATKAIIVNHGSNVDGLLLPMEAIGKIAKQLGLLLIVDTAQTAGVIPIDMERSGIGILCASGHKGLYGPAGIGILAVAPDVDIEPLVSGGTGSFSEDMDMPETYPDRFEPGSPNFSGIAGLDAGIAFIEKTGIEKIFRHKMKLCVEAYEGLIKFPDVNIFWPEKEANRLPLFSFTVGEMDPSEVAEHLDKKYRIATRTGLHCAPFAHKEIGTYPIGTVRVSPGFYNKRGDIKKLIKAVKDLSVKKKR